MQELMQVQSHMKSRKQKARYRQRKNNLFLSLNEEKERPLRRSFFIPRADSLLFQLGESICDKLYVNQKSYLRASREQ